MWLCLVVCIVVYILLLFCFAGIVYIWFVFGFRMWLPACYLGLIVGSAVYFCLFWYYVLSCLIVILG